jgi:hemerythrin-like domain-containing protein
VRERVAAERAQGGEVRAERVEPSAQLSEAEQSEYDRLGVRPTPDDGTRVSAGAPWDESTRPHRPESGPEVTYGRRGALVGQHLIDVHDMLRAELSELRELLAKVRDGAMSAGSARSALNEMALRQNDWTLGAFCARYCGALTQHHGLEDEAVFPHLAQSDPTLEPVIDRLVDEHLAIHDAIEGIDRALVGHINRPEDYEPIQTAIDFLTDALLSHLSYEEQEIVEPLARLGFYPGQL